MDITKHNKSAWDSYVDKMIAGQFRLMIKNYKLLEMEIGESF